TASMSSNGAVSSCSHSHWHRARRASKRTWPRSLSSPLDSSRPVADPADQGMTAHRLYFVPGMFGFGRLAGYDYFHHLREGLARRFADAGVELVSEIVPPPPTSSLRHRARMLARSIQTTASEGGPETGPIHLIG